MRPMKGRRWGPRGLLGALVVATALAAPVPAAWADAVDDLYAVAFNSTLTVASPGVLANDVGGVAVLAPPTATDQGGAIAVAIGGGFSYTPPPCFSGSDTFTYTALTADESTSTATVQIDVGAAPPASGCIPCPDPLVCPTAAADSYSTGSGVSLAVPAPGVLANDRGASKLAEYDTISLAGATVAVAGTGALTYQPPTGFTGDDQFEYTIDDGLGHTATATVTVAVNPSVASDAFSGPFNAKLSVSAPGVLANDGGIVGVWDFDTESSRGGAVAMTDDGAFDYTPGPCITGTDTFRYTGYSGDGKTLSTSVTITIAPRPADYGCLPCLSGSWCPDAVPDFYTGSGGRKVKAAAPGILANDRGAARITTYSTTGTRGGIVAIGKRGSFTYTPPNGFAGIDTFTYTISDGISDTASATDVVAIAPVLSAPAKASPVRTTRDVLVAWNKPTGAVSDVQYRYADPTGSFSAWQRWKTGMKGSQATLSKGAYGRTYCFQVRARNAAGIASQWSAARCQTVPARARDLKYSSGWIQVAAADAWGGTAAVTTAPGATANRTRLAAKHVYLVVTKCPTCGSVAVSWKGNVVATLSLAAPTTVRGAIVKVAGFSSVQTGALKITVTSTAGRPVVLEGFAAFRT